MSETDKEFVADMEWLHSHDREAALPPEKLARLFALARRGADAADEIERLRAALREIVDLGGAYGTASYADRADKIARAALKEDGDV